MKRFISLSLSLLISMSIYAQEKQKTTSLKGYVQTLEMIWIPPSTSQWFTMNTVSNRFDFRWYPSDHFKTFVAMRNIASYGQIPFDFYPYMADLSVKDNGELNLTKSIASDSSYYMYTNFDRFYVQYTNGNFEATLGRQRINWGVNMVWTPNDIFNSANYFDFDYMEKAGSDAVLLQYYTSMTSSLQFAAKLDQDDKLTYAALYRFNQWNYDFQILAGKMRDDLVIGAGWAGQIEGAGFSGEGTYFRNKDNFSDTTGVLVGSISLNYTFKNSLMLQAAILYNSAGTKENAGQQGMFALDLEVSAKNFTRAKFSTFLQASFPISPLINVSFSGMLNPNDKSGYLGPSFDISLTDNIGLMLMGQLFLGKDQTEFGDYGSMLFTRLKWSF